MTNPVGGIPRQLTVLVPVEPIAPLQSTAHVLHAVAENDHERSPETKGVLAAAYEKAGIPAEIEVYEGALHGWCSLDSPVYNQVQAEKAWSRLLALYERALV